LELGCVSAVDSSGRTIFVADAHRDNGKRFIVTADEKLTAFLELQRVTRESFRFPNPVITTLAILQHFPANCLYGGRNRLHVAV